MLELRKITKIEKMFKIKKTISKSLVLALIAALIGTTTVSAAGFTDVPITHKNYQAINYLKTNEIVNGYIDGTFQPDQSVNRAEFLKIVIEGSNIPTDINEISAFPDVDNSAWYAKYVSKAYHEGWINGYPDGSFKPTQTINKVEALKILGKAQSWSLPLNIIDPPFEDTVAGSWYISYLEYAKTHQFLEETRNTFNPGEFMTRAKISEVIYRTIVNASPPESEITDQPSKDIELEIPKEKPVGSNLNFTPVLQNTISSSFFSNVTLNETIPNTFYQDEVYIISGSISGNQKSITLILNNIATNVQITQSSEVTNKNFEIPIYFNQAGNYNIGLLPGSSGTSNATTISVIPSIPKETTNLDPPNKATQMGIEFKDDKTTVSFTPDKNTINKIIFTQNNKEKTYISRQSINEIPINYSDFAKFSEGTVSYQIKSAYIESDDPLSISSSFISNNSKTFTATTHQFSIKGEEINVNVPEKISNNQPISFSGTLDANAELEAFTIKPNGLVDSFNLSTNSPTSTYYSNTIINAGGSFNFNYNTSTSNSTYIVEINNQFGEALLNHPVYVGDIIPLLPDYFDSNERQLYSGALNLNSKRTELLNLINEGREDQGLSPITLANDISDLIAQPHAEDMANKDYFAHVNLENKTPSDRRISAGIQTVVSENIAKDVSIQFAHLELMRSAAHRKNILNPDWTRVGIGIAESEGYLFVVQEFSTNQISAQNLEEHKNELFAAINTKRNENGAAPLTYSQEVEAASNYLNDKAIIDGQTLTQDLFLEALNTSNVSGASEALVRVFNIWNQILTSIVNDEATIINPAWQKVGIDLQLDETGNIHTTLIINRN